jgi:hypothetical protein
MLFISIRSSRFYVCTGLIPLQRSLATLRQPILLISLNFWDIENSNDLTIRFGKLGTTLMTLVRADLFDLTVNNVDSVSSGNRA